MSFQNKAKIIIFILCGILCQAAVAAYEHEEISFQSHAITNWFTKIMRHGKRYETEVISSTHGVLASIISDKLHAKIKFASTEMLKPENQNSNSRGFNDPSAKFYARIRLSDSFFRELGQPQVGHAMQMHDSSYALIWLNKAPPSAWPVKLEGENSASGKLVRIARFGYIPPPHFPDAAVLVRLDVENTPILKVYNIVKSSYDGVAPTGSIYEILFAHAYEDLKGLKDLRATTNLSCEQNLKGSN